MTEKLKQLMHERADSVDFATPDLDAMTRSGDRTLRRRQGLAVLGGIAATAVLGVVAATAWDRSGADDPDVAVAAQEPAPLMWTVGSVLHHADGSTTDLGHEVRAFVRTADGLVFSDREGTVWSWVDGSASEVGLTDARSPQLVSDDEGDWAGWVDLTRPAPTFAVLDQATGTVTTYDGASGPASADASLFAAIDDGTAYWRGTSGAVIVDLASGDTTVIEIGDGGGFRLGDLEDGLVSVHTDLGTLVRRLAGDQVASLDGVHGSLGSFSPDARYYFADADEPQVYDVATGEQVDLDLDGREFGTGYEWLGQDTLAVLAAQKPRDDSVAELMTCEVPAGTCELIVELGTFEAVAGTLALPTGTSTGE